MYVILECMIEFPEEMARKKRIWLIFFPIQFI